jgi:hypothetical protein
MTCLDIAQCRTAIDEELTPHEQRVFAALALNGVPIVVPAPTLEHDSRRGLHDASRVAPDAPASRGDGIKDGAIRVSRPAPRTTERLT